MGFSKSFSCIFLSRRVSEIRRIEQFVHGIIDSILLCDWKIFVSDSDYKVLKVIVRNAIKTCTFSIGEATKMWKLMTTYIFRQTALQDEKAPNGPFRCLRSFKRVDRLLQGSLDKQDLEGLAHLSSSRQLPAADKKKALKSWNDFVALTTTEFQIDSELLMRCKASAERIGKFIRDKGYRKGSSHISLSTAATLNSTVKDGGRANDIIAGITPFLTGIPLQEEVYNTPMGSYKCPAGIARWRTLARPETYSFWTDDIPSTLVEEEYEYEGVVYKTVDGDPGTKRINFGEILPKESLNAVYDVECYRQGFDEAIGLQILIIAYLEYLKWKQTDGKSLFARAIFVPEPGYKSRMVTTTEWWVNILQQGPAHIMRGFLEQHPSAISGLMRTDQAWQSLYLAKNAKDFPPNSKVLSGDLSEATDHIPWDLAKGLIQWFCIGVGYASPLLDIAMELLTTSHNIISEFGACSTIRGVPMGEPPTKAVLTLYNIVVEDLAIRDFLKRQTGAVSVPWRLYAVGGDDHLAAGPEEYLMGISRTHTRLGSMSSPDKTIISDRVVKYCEKLIMVKPFLNFYDKNPNSVNFDSKSYDESPWIDSIKLRLLSPCSKSTEITNERNVSVGKGKSLGNTIRWLPQHHFPTKWVQMVRDRFFMRMGSLLPDRTSGVYWHLLLPEKLGGLGLWVESDFVDLSIRLPDISKRAILEILKPPLERDKGFLRSVKSFTSNSTFRAYILKEDEKSALEKSLYETINSSWYPKYSFKDAILETKLDPKDSAALNAMRLNRMGFRLESELLEEILRPLLFKEILSGEVKSTAYNTVPFKRRYAKLWDAYYNGINTISAENVKEAVYQRYNDLFYDIRQTAPLFYRGRPIHNVPHFKRVTYGMPDLTIDYKLIGEIV